jgi:hypothetical protein
MQTEVDGHNPANSAVSWISGGAVSRGATE